MCFSQQHAYALLGNCKRVEKIKILKKQLSNVMFVDNIHYRILVSYLSLKLIIQRKTRIIFVLFLKKTTAMKKSFLSTWLPHTFKIPNTFEFCNFNMKKPSQLTIISRHLNDKNSNPTTTKTKKCYRWLK
jgi:hypothetical protein